MKTSRFPKFEERVCSEFVDNSHSLENVRLLSKSPYLTGHIKMNYETGYIERFSEKKSRDISRTIETSKVELFVALVISVQPLTSFTKNSNIGAMGVLNALLEYYNIFWNLYR